MFSLIVIAFFALTGITLNHPDWVFGAKEAKRVFKGTLPSGSFEKGKMDWLHVVEQLRAEHSLRGRAEDMRATETEGSLAFKAPGYMAECLFDSETGKYELTVTTSSAVAMLNDLHRGQNSGKSWGVLIDVAGIFLTVVSLTGIGFMFFLKKIRASALIAMTVGLVIAIAVFRTTF